MREIAWRRPMSPAEAARLAEWLESHPEARAEWEADEALNAALVRLMTQSAPSNLASRALAEIDRLEAVAAKRPAAAGWRGALRWLPRVALAAVVVGGGVYWLRQPDASGPIQAPSAQTEALARLATVTEPDGMPSFEALENFEVILKLHPQPLADMELLSLSRQLAEFKP